MRRLTRSANSLASVFLPACGSCQGRRRFSRVRILLALGLSLILLLSIALVSTACIFFEMLDPSPTVSPSATPFGLHPADVFKPGYPDNGFTDAQNIGVQWNRPGLYAFWFIVQPDLTEPIYDFSHYDRRWGDVPTDIRILANIAPQSTIDEGRCLPGSWLPVDIAQYTDFVKATVERYDGDGLNDMPGLANPIKYWQVGNEPNGQFTERADFAELQLMTYQAIREACPDCTVLIGGVAGFPKDYILYFDTRYAPILAELDGRGIDVFDFHWYGTAMGDYRLADATTGEDVLDHIQATLDDCGFPSTLPIWITEMGSYSGDPAEQRFEPQTERQQAGDYFKRFIYPLSRGVKKVFPAYGLIEGFKHNDGYFDHTGLIYDGEYADDLGLGVKKLAYYTYKKMTTELSGADWATLTMLHDGSSSDHLYVFRVVRDGVPIHIAWWDYFDEAGYTPGDTKTLSLTGLSGTAVRATAVVPSVDTGQDVTDFATAFTTTTHPVSDGSASIALGTDPVLLEPVTSSVPSDAPYSTIVEAFDLVAPSGNTIYGLVRRPDPAMYPEEAFPAVIRIPGGIGAGRMAAYSRESQVLSEAGMVVVTFNAEGRVNERAPNDLRSEGNEDYNGFRHQDGLARIVEMTAGLSFVDPQNVGLWSQSYGITMAAGCVGRYPDLPIKYLVDTEGPSDSFVTCFGPRYLAGDYPAGQQGGVQFGRRATWEDASPENLEWWSEREAVRYIGRFRGQYLRLQSTWDHAQPPSNHDEIDDYYHPSGWPGGGPAWWHNKHATDMANAAIDGGAPWVRVNLPEQGNSINATYDAENPPVFIPGELVLGDPRAVQAVFEMAGLSGHP